MRRDLALADIDVAPRGITTLEQLAQMVIGAAVAETQFQHGAVEFLDQLGSAVEAGALRLEAADEAVETAHAAG